MLSVHHPCTRFSAFSSPSTGSQLFSLFGYPFHFTKNCPLSCLVLWSRLVSTCHSFSLSIRIGAGLVWPLPGNRSSSLGWQGLTTEQWNTPFCRRHSLESILTLEFWVCSSNSMTIKGPLHPGCNFLDLADSVAKLSPNIITIPPISTGFTSSLLFAAVLVDVALARFRAWYAAFLISWCVL